MALMLALTLALALCGAAANRFRDNTPLFDNSFQVRTLDAAGFDEMLNATHEVWLVDFYSPWCPHCRDFAPAWEKIAAFYAESPNVHVGAVDCTKQDAVCTREKIFGYPAVKLFHVPTHAAAAVRYAGAKRVKDVVTWLEASLYEVNMQSGIDPERMADKLALVLGDRVADPVAGGPLGKPKDQSLAMKYTRLRDAGAAAVFTLENQLFLGTDVLEGARYAAAMQWLGALAASFPLEVNRAAFASLAEAAGREPRWAKPAWLALMAQWKRISQRTTFPRNLLASNEEAGWANCGTYTCGLWTLFHSMSVGVDAALSPNSPVPVRRPSEVAAAIRAFVEHFFGCELCVKHFLAANPPSVIEALAARDAEGPQALVVWLWRMHNKVNKVTKKGFWPAVAECPVCYTDHVATPSFDPAALRPDAIAAFVRSVYAHREADTFAMDYESNGLAAVLAASLEGFGALLAGGAFFVVFAVVVKAQGHRFVDFQRKFGRQHTA
ncbi:hypothetical protein PybrP1_013122 [[Pythium] brassicae (nom. inval.)]|nr:hypothetical protein PybrP1_013122 [[Pythium] brassicae (nom. inval.)]